MADGYTSFRQARHFTPGRTKKIRLGVVHSTESLATAEATQGYFGTTDRKASAHVTHDYDSSAGSVHLTDTAWAAVGANSDGAHAEHRGKAAWSRAQWLDKRLPKDGGTGGYATLMRSAAWMARYVCHQYGVPARWLTPEQIKAGVAGLCTHADISKAYPGTGHYDPGVGFPKDVYLTLVQHALANITHPPQGSATTPTSPATHPVYPVREIVVTTGSKSSPNGAVRAWQSKMIARGWKHYPGTTDTVVADGVYGPKSASLAREFGHEKTLPVKIVNGYAALSRAIYDAAWTAPVTR